ncbi:MAG: TonB-dependent receptor [Prevotella sp.]|nr:TonB-dependent receptor [Prevotella sp.]
MNLNLRKTVLLMSACTAFGLAWPASVFADAANSPANAVQQQKTVSGTVVDAQGPVIGATIMEKGTSNGTVTDFDGNFTLNVQPGATLVVSYVGYLTQEFPVGNSSNFNITLNEDNKALEEVVVVGYGTMKKKLVTGATVQVKGDDIAKLNTTNALTAMQSATPGVNITQASAQPGKGFKVNIRGVGTIGNTSPLLIIDGVTSGTADDGLNGLNPSDIESIDVLKDAASAAIYGSRAANGVILVTTKQGKAGKIQINYDGYVGWSNPYKRPATLNAQEYMRMVSESNFNTYGTVINWNSLIPADIKEKLDNGWQGTDWFELYRNKNAMQVNHSLSINGGSERSKFALGVNWSNNEGIMGGDVASSFKRYSGRINSEHILLKGKTHDVITIGENVSYWYHKTHDLPEGNGYWNVMQNAYSASPLVPAYAEDGSFYNYKNYGAGWSTDIFSNPLHGLYAGQYNAINRNRTFGVGATFYWIVEPIKNLKYRGSVNTGYSSSSYRNYSQPYSSSFTSASSNYGLQQGISNSSSLSMDNTLSYVLPQFIEKNNIDIMIGQAFEKTEWGNSMSISGTVSSDDSELSSFLTDFNSAYASHFTAKQITGFSGLPSADWSIASFFGRLNWNYDEKYMATFTFRADASSNFAKGNRWGYFPSISAGWNVSNESWMESTRSWMDFLKLRASWGQNGNQDITNFQYLAGIEFTPSDYADYAYKFGSSVDQTLSTTDYKTGAIAKNVANPDVTWETSEQLNFGIDARFLRSRLGLNFDWYKKKTKDWLVPVPKPDVAGVNEYTYYNAGDIENKGIELALSWDDQIGSDFRYHAKFNIATNKNKVTRLANKTGYMYGSTNALFQNSSYVSVVEVGHPVAYFSGMSYSGIWQNQEQIDAARAAGKAVLADAKPGDMIWDDYSGPDGKPDGVIDYATDRHEIGDPNPDVTMGLSLGFDYKGFDFNITGSGQFGMQVMQCYRTALLANQYINYTQDVYNRWHGEGTSNSQPRLSVGSTNDQWVSTRYMQDADFFRIQNVTVGYDFTKLWKTSPFQQLRLYFQAQNLVTFTGYTGVDPEIGSSGGTESWARGIDVGLYPISRTYLVGVNIKF